MEKGEGGRLLETDRRDAEMAAPLEVAILREDRATQQKSPAFRGGRKNTLPGRVEKD